MEFRGTKLGYGATAQFVYAPNAPHYDTELLECHFDGEKFVLKTRAGYQRMSKVTDSEDLSYVSSPMLPEVGSNPKCRLVRSVCTRNGFDFAPFALLV